MYNNKIKKIEEIESFEMSRIENREKIQEKRDVQDIIQHIRKFSLQKYDYLKIGKPVIRKNKTQHAFHRPRRISINFNKSFYKIIKCLRYIFLSRQKRYFRIMSEIKKNYKKKSFEQLVSNEVRESLTKSFNYINLEVEDNINEINKLLEEKDNIKKEKSTIKYDEIIHKTEKINQKDIINKESTVKSNEIIHKTEKINQKDIINKESTVKDNKSNEIIHKTEKINQKEDIINKESTVKDNQNENKEEKFNQKENIFLYLNNDIKQNSEMNTNEQNKNIIKIDKSTEIEPQNTVDFTTNTNFVEDIYQEMSKIEISKNNSNYEHENIYVSSKKLTNKETMAISINLDQQIKQEQILSESSYSNLCSSQKKQQDNINDTNIEEIQEIQDQQNNIKIDLNINLYEVEKTDSIKSIDFNKDNKEIDLLDNEKEINHSIDTHLSNFESQLLENTNRSDYFNLTNFEPKKVEAIVTTNYSKNYKEKFQNYCYIQKHCNSYNKAGQHQNIQYNYKILNELSTYRDSNIFSNTTSYVNTQRTFNGIESEQVDAPTVKRKLQSLQSIDSTIDAQLDLKISKASNHDLISLNIENLEQKILSQEKRLNNNYKIKYLNNDILYKVESSFGQNVNQISECKHQMEYSQNNDLKNEQIFEDELGEPMLSKNHLDVQEDNLNKIRIMFINYLEFLQVLYMENDMVYVDEFNRVTQEIAIALLENEFELVDNNNSITLNWICKRIKGQFKEIENDFKSAELEDKVVQLKLLKNMIFKVVIHTINILNEEISSQK